MIDISAVEKEFHAVLNAFGCILNRPPVMDGKWHSVKTESDRGSKKSGSYRGFLDGVPAGTFRNWKSGITEKWRYGIELNEKEKKEMSERLTRDKNKRHLEKERAYTIKARECRNKWESLKDNVVISNYLDRKQVGAHNIRQEIQGNLIIPIRDSLGVIWSLQTIGQNGFKKYEKDCQKAGFFHIVGMFERLRDYQTIMVAEGYSTASTIYEATGRPVVVAFDSHNLYKVAKALRRKYKGKNILIMGDDDHHLPNRKVNPLPNVGRVKAIEAANVVKGQAILPEFTPQQKAALNPDGKPTFTDYNDLMCSMGKAAFEVELKRLICKALG